MVHPDRLLLPCRLRRPWDGRYPIDQSSLDKHYVPWVFHIGRDAYPKLKKKQIVYKFASIKLNGRSMELDKEVQGFERT